MSHNQQLKEIVREKYSEIALTSLKNNSCCGPTSCCDTSIQASQYTMFSDNYSSMQGYHPDADLGLGCGTPTEFASIQQGETVLDLGSGAGNDAFIARALVGESGKVIGLDMTQLMVDKAITNAKKMNYTNVEFVLGDIEAMPLPNEQIDVVLSNCVLNLVPDKQKAFQEMYRVLKPGGRFSVSDIVIQGNLPDDIKKSAEMYAGCVAGAIPKERYLQMMKETGFTQVEIVKEKKIVIPKEILSNFLSPNEMEQFETEKTGIISITVTGYKGTH